MFNLLITKPIVRDCNLAFSQPSYVFAYHNHCFTFLTTTLTQATQEIYMADLTKQFEQAVADSKTLSERPDNGTLLKLYALYKQGSAGDVDGKRPGFTDMVGRAKWDAWNEIKGTEQKTAMSDYIELIESLK
jgi:diazepam-binding inhibitor (GABA receptor modulator, acyl-CoA-binding protein)